MKLKATCTWNVGWCVDRVTDNLFFSPFLSWPFKIVGLTPIFRSLFCSSGQVRSSNRTDSGRVEHNPDPTLPLSSFLPFPTLPFPSPHFLPLPPTFRNLVASKNRSLATDSRSASLARSLLLASPPFSLLAPPISFPRVLPPAPFFWYPLSTLLALSLPVLHHSLECFLTHEFILPLHQRILWDFWSDNSTQNEISWF